MNETEWLTTVNPSTLLHHIEWHPEIATVRQMRLFRAAISRLLWDFLEPPALKACITALEEYAVGAISNDALRAVIEQALPHRGSGTSVYALASRVICGSHHHDDDVGYECRMVYSDVSDIHRILTSVAPRRQHLTWDPAFEANYPEYFTGKHQNELREARSIPANAPQVVVDYISQQIRLRELYAQEKREVEEAQYRTLSHILRDLVPNPFRPITELCPDWINDEVAALARQIRETGNYRLMWELGDLLQGAGAHYEAISHCYNDHVPGCWYLESVLSLVGTRSQVSRPTELPKADRNSVPVPPLP